ncbi:MAG: hypothetical protein ACTSR8_11780 [Promethearchaeota archaeon]
MTKTAKIFTSGLLIVLILASNIAQVNNVATSVPSDLEDNSKSKPPQTSDFSQSYNLEGGNTMQIDATVTGDDGTTMVSMDNSTHQENVQSNFIKGQDAINNGSATTFIGTDKTIETLGDNKTTLKDSTSKLNISIDNDFNPHGAEIEAKNVVDATNAKVTTGAEVSNDKTKLKNWQWNVESFFDVTYDVDIPAPGDQGMDISDGTSTISIVRKAGSTYTIISFFGIEEYNLTSAGNVYNRPSGSPIWNFIGIVGNISFTGIGSSLESKNDTIILKNFVNTFEIVVVKIGAKYDISVYSILYSFILVWTAANSIVTIYWGLWIYTFYLILIAELMYVIVYYDYDIKIEYYATYVIIVWLEIIIEIWFLDLYIYWVVYYIWSWWHITFEWWFIYETTYWYFYDYYVSIEYRWTNYHWYYYYYVPTLYIPNMLRLNIIDSVYAKDTFLFVVQVTDYIGNLVTSGVSFAGSTWDETLLTGANLTDNGDGTWDINVTAKRVLKGAAGIELNLTVSKNGYGVASLIQSIAVQDFSATDELGMSVWKSIFTETIFNITIWVMNLTDNSGVSGATITVTWDGVDESSKVHEIGGGFYYIELTPKTTAPNDPPLALAFNIIADGFNAFAFTTWIGVDPEVISKGDESSDDKKDEDSDNTQEPLAIAGASMLLIGITSLLATIYLAQVLSKKRRKL